jgi:hypothetical protein
VRTFEGARAPFVGWRFALEPALGGGGFVLFHLERSEEWRQERLLSAERNARINPRLSDEIRGEALATSWPTELREERWLTEWLKAGLVREVRS